MATRKPLIVNNGQVEQIQSGDYLILDTPPPNDNSTKAATTAYVDTKEQLIFQGGFPATTFTASGTLYFSNVNGLSATATQSFSKFGVPKNFTVTKVVLICSQNVNASNQACSLYIRENATTDQAITTTLDLSTVGLNSSKIFRYNLATPITLNVANDYEMKLVLGAFTIAPTNNRWHFELWGY